MRNTTRIAAWLGAFALIGGSMAYAATDGALGTDSTGTVGITLQVNAQAQITGLTDFDFGTYDPSSSADLSVAHDNVCVYSKGDSTANGYTITLSSDNGAQAGLYMANPNLDTLDYQVFWTAGSEAEEELVAGPNPTTHNGATSTDCTTTGDPKVSIRVLVTNTNIGAAPAGTYTDVLTITIDPV